MEQPRKSHYNRDRWELDKIRYHVDQRPPPKRDVKQVGELLEHVLKGFEKPKSEHLTVLQESWPKLCGAVIAQHSKPLYIRDSALYVSVDLPGFLPELERIKRFLLQKLQANYRELNIRQLRFQLAYR